MYKNKTLNNFEPRVSDYERNKKYNWSKIIHLTFIGKTVLTTFECVAVRYILHYHIGQ